MIWLRPFTKGAGPFFMKGADTHVQQSGNQLKLCGERETD